MARIASKSIPATQLVESTRCVILSEAGQDVVAVARRVTLCPGGRLVLFETRTRPSEQHTKLFLDGDTIRVLDERA